MREKEPGLGAPHPAKPLLALRRGTGTAATELVIGGRIGREDIVGLCRRAARLLVSSGAADDFVCDVGGLIEPDAVAVDTLARLQLTARRLGCRMRLYDASPELRELLALVGLMEIVPPNGLVVEPGRQTEQREERLGVEEERDPGDPAV